MVGAARLAASATGTYLTSERPRSDPEPFRDSTSTLTERQQVTDNLNIPNALPVLSAGHHPWGSGRACAMDAVSFIMGRPEQGDAPECIHEVLRSAFIRTNDALPDERRHELWPLILRAMGSTDRAPTDELEAKRLNVGLAVWCARQVLHLVRVKDRQVCEDAIVAAERWVADPSEANANAAAAAAAAYANAAAAAAAYAAAAAAAAADAAADAADAADADARARTLQACADIVRQHYPVAPTEKRA